ncbi:hypothetical protein X975_23180, partial [Stegodyphus mimosarum]
LPVAITKLQIFYFYKVTNFLLAFFCLRVNFLQNLFRHA